MKPHTPTFAHSLLFLVAASYLAIFLGVHIYRGYVQGNKAIRDIYSFVVDSVGGKLE